MRLRVLCSVVAVTCAATLGVAATSGESAYASVSIAVTWDSLLHTSSAAALVTPVEARSVWENGSIYTYTRVNLDRLVAGDMATGGDVWVRTMGGVVDKIGQIVEGEAVLATGQTSLVFLHPGPVGAFEVTARGQGQFPVVAAQERAPARVVRSLAMGALVAPHLGVSPATTRLAADVLHGRPVDAVAGDIAADWSRTHAR